MNQEQLEHKRHSLAHLLAAAVLKLWPDTKRTIGPAIENGFYYDFEFSSPITEAHLPKIEKEMKRILQTWKTFERQEVSATEAKKIFSDNEYKLELIEEFSKEGQTLTLYTSGDFTDLCRGGHTENMREIKPDSFCLDKIAGAYWRGDEKNKMLTRIYGLAFETKEELENYITMMAEAKKRDHRKLGKELDLFVFSDLVGPGMPMFTPKGFVIRQEIVNFSNELQKSIGFLEVHTPQVNKAELFKISGHYDKYKDDMLMVKSHYSDEEYFLKPMNCPQHTQLFASQKRSYRDLPIRYSDFANLFRDERPGELSGLTRLRCFAQDDGHSFCREDQIEEEFNNILGIVKKALETYSLDYYIRLSLWDEKQKEKYLGDKSTWEKSQALLENLLEKNKTKYIKAEGEAAFYGPKMDIMAKDAIGREWQISTIQLDFNMPIRFKLGYIDKDGQEKYPVMIHRAIIGSPDRFLGVLLEHYAGAFPLWLSPVQVKIINVGETHEAHCQKLAERFLSQNIRVELDLANETVGNKIRKASNEKIPYTLVIGDKEASAGSASAGSAELAVRVRGEEKLLEIGLEKFIEKIKNLIAGRKNLL